jgi:hypothetical protein
MNPLGELFRQSRERDALAVKTYAELKALSKRGGHVRTLEYRCPSRCLLAEILKTPEGDTIVHTPGYKLSPTLNAATSSASGRAKNTRDGNRKWKARTFFTVDSSNISLNCDHIRQQILALAELDAGLASGHAEKIVYPSRRV